MNRYRMLQRVLDATERLSPSSTGGAHTDVFRFDSERLRRNLQGTLPGGQPSGAQEEAVETLGRQYLVKKGKIRHFSMPLVSRHANNDLRRTLMSYAFGPVGYNIMPTLEKTVLDATEAARLVPYLGCGDPDGLFAPDFLDALAEGKPLHNPRGEYLRIVVDGDDTRHTLFEILRNDIYFHGRVANATDLADHQRFLRKNPLTAAMGEALADFFEGPITVGVRDTIRRLKGSHHPAMAWERARGIIERSFDRQGTESFLLPEITYYAYDTSFTSSQVQALLESNRVVAGMFARQVEGALPRRLLGSWQAAGGERVALELLDFHHDYKLYDVEPYSGLLSVSAARMAARTALAVFLEVVDGVEPRVRNTDFRRLPAFHHQALAWLGSLGEADREQATEVLASLLGTMGHEGGIRDSAGVVHRFSPVPRTFYTFQRKADVTPPGRKHVALHTIHELWDAQKAHVWERHPDLAEKLTVFYMQVYRYFQDTGFVPDLRPRHAGRDIFVLGIWGYVTENLLVVEEEDGAGRPCVRVAFVDNRDQFKQYRRGEDRRHNLGLAKHALRLIYPIIEPAMLRSIGLVVEKAGAGTAATETARPSPVDLGLDITYKLVKDHVDSGFTTTKAMMDDIIDDVHAGSKNLVKKVGKAKLKRSGARP